ncbi:MAG TPA: hypothetical protein VK814_13720 [Acidobacteriaceae bacterium]|jgi:hypothetical protein|nr:hypothetical protein [Acidobacteriaceae bacterium]
MADKDVALAILQAAIAIAGLVLIYSGFLAAKGADYRGDRAGDKFLRMAKLGLIPVIIALFCSGMGVRVLRIGHWGHDWCATWLILAFEIVLATTAVYAIIAAFLST